jgi:hypothetical protein
MRSLKGSDKALHIYPECLKHRIHSDAEASAA